jgi:hypothetical protein
MARKIFVNLPVKDLERSKAFFGRLGFSFDPQFTDATAASMVISDDIYVMLLTRAKFEEILPPAVRDSTRSTAVLTGLSCDSRAAVDEVVAKAVAAGARTFEPPEDHGFCYSHAFQDLDGHLWNWFWMDPSAVKPS